MNAGRVIRVVGLVVCLQGFLAATVLADSVSFTEQLGSNPFSSSGGNFSISSAPGLAADTYNQFTWDAATSSKYAGDPDGSRVVGYDSSKPAVRLERRLPQTVGMDRDFSFGTRMTIRSTGFSAPETDYFQITFALANSTLTGANRAGSYTEGADVYHDVEFCYYPNVAFWGGPTLQVDAFGEKLSGTDITAFSNFASPGFDEGDLGYNGSGQIKALPLDTPLDIDIAYAAATQVLTLKISRVESDGSLTQLLLSDTGVIDIDLSGAEYSSGAYASNNFDKDHPFLLDSLVISSYYDYWAVASPSLYATVDFDQFRFEVQDTVPEPVTLMLLGTGTLLLFTRRRR